jgi:hypothetical protein
MATRQQRRLAPARRIWLIAVVVALLPVLGGVEAVPAVGDATVAAKKKKCRLGYVKVKKKNKCKLVAPAGVRATLTWTNATGAPVDVDLFVFEPNGNQAGGGPNTIANSTMSPDSQGAGPEIFSDSLTPSIRDFTFAACMASNNGITSTIATLVYRLPTGVTQTISSVPGQLANNGNLAYLHFGTFRPAISVC